MVGDCWSQQASSRPRTDEIQPDSISLIGNSNGITFSFLDDGNTSSHDEFQFVFGNGIVATLIRMLRGCLPKDLDVHTENEEQIKLEKTTQNHNLRMFN